MATSVLITGASGLIGVRLTDKLLQKGYQVSHLGRSKKSGKVPSFVWDASTGSAGKVDVRAFEGVDAIIHLAGAGVAEKRWTHQRKKLILDSRTESSGLLYEKLKTIDHSVKTLVSASAIGYYGGSLDNAIVKEDSQPGDDYLANVVVAWEKAVDSIGTLGIRVAKIRIGIVLSEKGGALKEMAAPVRWGVGAPLGTGRQLVSWIHLDDLCNLFVKALEDKSMQGPYNGVSPQPITNQEMTKAIATVLNRPLWLPAIPAIMLRMIVGEMAYVILTGSNVSSERIQKAGFEFQFPRLEDALRDLLKTD